MKRAHAASCITSHLIFSFLVVWAASSQQSRADDAKPEIGLRIAILANQDADGELLSVERALEGLRVSAGLKEPLRIARGTYADLWHWLETGAVDLAVVSPALLAKALELGGAVRWEYLGSVRTPSVPSASSSVAVVRDDSSVRTTEDLERLLSSGEGRLYFVDPLSVSGTLAPRIALAGVRNSLAESRIRYTHSHTNSLRSLRLDVMSDAVAFVSSGMLAKNAMKGLRTVELPALARLRIPPDALIVRAEFRPLDQLRKAVSAADAPRSGAFFVAEPAWRDANAEIREWLSVAGDPSPERLMRLDLEELGQLFVHYARSRPTPLRIAVVFSGGGAKCAYQVGAIRAIEEKLAELREQTADATIDISLVVGTSGGAINALPVAMGMSSSPALYEEMAAVWRTLDQRKIIRPALIVRLNMAFWFASIEFLLFSWIGRHRTGHGAKSHLGRWLLCLIAGALQVVLARLPFDPWSTLGPRPGLHRLYLWLTFGAEGAGWILIAAGAVGLVLRATRAEGRPAMVLFRRLTRMAAFAGILVLPALQAWTILGYKPTLSEGDGIEEMLLGGFSRLVNAKRLADGKRPAQVSVPTDKGTREESLHAMSRQIIGEGMISRDLVLTGSVIGEPGVEIAPDLYFWVSAGRTSQQPGFGARGVSLARHPQLLLDSLMASGAIYPVFPARTIRDFPRTGENTEIVDGSFAHRSPVEAAVLWGASHIILIQADPDELVPRGSFAANIAAALTHLYEQAQLTDVRTKEQAMVFNLAPRPPHIGLLDFASNLIDASIAKGYREVRGASDAGAPQTPPFRKEVGVPHFVVVKASDGDATRSSH